MKFLEFAIIAIRSLLANKLRSALTMLGMIIGVGAVISLMSIGRGVQAEVVSLFEQQGSNVLYVQPRNPEAPGFAGLSPAFATPSLNMDDARALADIPSVLGVAAVNENFIEVVAGNNSTTVIAQGTTPSYLEAYAYKMAAGQFISDRNVTRKDTVVVLGDKTAKDLFGTKNAVGESVKIKGRRFTTIGVLERKGGAFMGFSMDDVVVMPITTFQARVFSQQIIRGGEAVQSIALPVASKEAMDGVKAEAESILRKRHRIDPYKKDDFTVISQEQFLGVFEQITGLLTIFLGAIAGISLLVGSIGIMNIMLVSVTERTREIGLRKAVGAKRRDILVQFLMEAATLSFVGGGIGLMGGYLVSRIISLINFGGTTIRATVSPDIIILAVSVSVFIGLASGIYPAMRAARLNPIDALHYG
ncbi:MAG: ABC transporter permease [Chloroflexi bacterium]|nr:ABC transporter permease [Chloroflexota bacterium]